MWQTHYHRIEDGHLTLLGDINFCSFAFVTPQINDMSGVIVLARSVCVCLSLTGEQRHTDLNFGMQVKWMII